MLLEIAMGDAYGAGFEFSSEDKVSRFNNLTAYHDHDLGILAGHYTDDTQMSIAICELLISGCDWSRINIAQKFVECFKRDERFGYSKRFQQFLSSIDSGEEFLNKMDPESTRNGAAMRSAPLGYVRNIETLLSMAKTQAEVTHNTETGIRSSQAVALASHYFIYSLGSKLDVTEFVSHHTKFKWNDRWSSPVACCGEETVNALLTVIRECESLRDVLIRSVSFCGDVDTVAAVGLGIASQSELYESTLPNFLYEDLESGTYGRKYLAELGEQMKNL